MSELEERRQRAREAFHDTFALNDRTTSDALDECIETATRVQITPEVIDAYQGTGMPSLKAKLRAAFRAAGFEVIE